MFKNVITVSSEWDAVSLMNKTDTLDDNWNKVKWVLGKFTTKNLVFVLKFKTHCTLKLPQSVPVKCYGQK